MGVHISHTFRPTSHLALAYALQDLPEDLGLMVSPLQSLQRSSGCEGTPHFLVSYNPVTKRCRPFSLNPKPKKELNSSAFLAMSQVNRGSNASASMQNHGFPDGILAILTQSVLRSPTAFGNPKALHSTRQVILINFRAKCRLYLYV